MEREKTRLFILCDGTWQDGVNDNERLTNVATLARSLRTAGSGYLQLLYYDSGIGNGTSKPAEGIDAMTGRGISAKIRNAYSFLSHNYDFESSNHTQANEIFLVGFSRGAFAVQCLASLLNEVGLLQPGYLYFLRGLFTLWSKQQLSRPKTSHETANQASEENHNYVGMLQEGRALHKVKVKALVVWDTVSALGIPGHLGSKPLSFVGHTVPGIVENAFHALALDERRKSFKPQVWRSKEEVTTVVKQCWFLGTHVDVGGNGDADLGSLTLLWMIGQLSAVFNDISIDETEIDKHLTHKFLKWDFEKKWFSRDPIQDACLFYTAGTGKPTEPSPLWRLAGTESRKKYLARDPEDTVAHPTPTEIHFSVRLILSSGGRCAVLENWKTAFDSDTDRTKWQQGDKGVFECNLSQNSVPQAEDTSDMLERNEYTWLSMWCNDGLDDSRTLRTYFSSKNNIEVRKAKAVDRWVTKALKEKMEFVGTRLAPGVVYPPPRVVA